MLYQVGGLQFTTMGLGPHEISREAEEDFAWKAVVGGLKPPEHTGEGDDVLKLTCKLFTRKQTGFSALGSLEQMKLSGTPQIVVRGDGFNLGWRVLTNFSEKHRFLDISGVGKIIEYDLTLKKARKPSAAGMLTALYQLAPSGLTSLFSQLQAGG